MKMFGATRIVLAAAVFGALSGSALGQEKIIVLRAARMFDGHEMRDDHERR